MSTHQSLVLDECSTPLSVIPSLLRALLQTIFFQRSVGSIRPVEIDSEVLPGVCYVASANEELDKIIEGKIAEIHRSLSSQQNVPEHVQVIVYFFEKHIKKGLFSKSEEKVLFEQWVLPLHIETTGMSTRSLSDIAADTRDRLQKIIRMTDAKKEHIPPVSSVEAHLGCYPFVISLPGYDSAASSGLSAGDPGFLKRLVRG